MNRFTNLSTSGFKDLSLEEIMMVPMAKQKQADDLNAAAGEYSALQSKRLSQDAEVVDGKLSELRGRADSISESMLENGVNRNLIRQFRNLKRDKEREFGQQGIIGAAAGNYTSAMTFVNDLATKKEQQAGWSPKRAKAWAEAQVKGFKGTLNEDGSFGTFQGKGLDNKVDRNDWINKNLKNVAADTDPLALKYAGSLDEFHNAFRSGKITQKSFNKIMGSLSSMAANDTDLMTSLQQESFFTGEQDATNIGKWSIRKDPKTGKNEEVFEPGSSFGRQLYAAASGNKSRSVAYDYRIVEDKAAWELYKKGLETQEADDLVRAAYGEANTITADNIDKIRDNTDLALNEMTRQEGMLNNFKGDKTGREYQELKANHDNSKIKYFNLKNKIEGIEKEVVKTLTKREQEGSALWKSLDEEIPGYRLSDNIEDKITVLEDAIRQLPGGSKIIPEHGMDQIGSGAENIEAFLLSKYFELKGHDVDKSSRANRGLYNWIGDKDLAYDSDIVDKMNDGRFATKKGTKTYLEQNPYAESYTEFGGLDSGKGTSAIGLINKNLSENFDGANYSVAYTGESLNALMAEKYGESEIIKEIRTTNGYDEMGHPIEHLIIRDKATGNVLESKSVTRGSLGLVENRKVAASLVGSSDPTLNREGRQMMANITFMPVIKKAGLRDGGEAGIFPGKSAMINGESQEISWEKRTNYNGSDVWVVKIGDSIESDDLYGENEIASYLANLGKKK